MARNAALRSLKTLVLALPETSGSALYGMVDVLKSAGNLWQTLTSREGGTMPFDVRIVSDRRRPFECGNGIPVTPDVSFATDARPDIVIVPEMWLGPEEHLDERHGGAKRWLRTQFDAGAFVYSACSGALLLAAAGLLDGREATSHWGYRDLFERKYPKIRFQPEPTLCFADKSGRLVTAGGTTSWHDLALHIISRHVNPGEAQRIARIYLLKRHDEGQLPYGPLVRRRQHPDAQVRACEDWLAKNFRMQGAVRAAVRQSGIPERTLKRRFRAATGTALIDYVQNLRIDEARRLLEEASQAADEVSAQVGYEDASFFRRVFKRLTGLSPGAYRRMFSRTQFQTPLRQRT